MHPMKVNSMTILGFQKITPSPILIRVGLLAIFISLTSCGKKAFDTEKELWAYVQDKDNGYTQNKTINGVEYSVVYKPTDLLVQQELGTTYTSEQVDSLRSKYHKYMYFTLSLSKNNQELLTNVVGDKNRFGAMVNQLAFGMGEKVHLISEKRDSIPLADYVYPRMYGMGGVTSMLFVYPREEKLLASDFFSFTIEDIGFATGEVGFRMQTKPIKNEPQLNIK
jgi:hypothetical protein